MIYKVNDDDRTGKKPTIKVDAKVSCLKYLDGRVYIGLKNGMLLVYSRDQGQRSALQLVFIFQYFTFCILSI